MIVKTVTETKKSMASLLDAVENDRVPVLITRGAKPPAIMLSYDEYRGWQETLHLLGSAKNARRLDAAMADYRAGKAQERDLAGPDE